MTYVTDPTEGAFGHAFLNRPLETMDDKERTLHAHYESNYTAEGHAQDCRRVTRPVNWPTLFGVAPCSCGKG